MTTLFLIVFCALALCPIALVAAQTPTPAPTNATNATNATDAPRPFDVELDDPNWPGLIPNPTLVINIQTDNRPKEIDWVFEKLVGIKPNNSTENNTDTAVSKQGQEEWMVVDRFVGSDLPNNTRFFESYIEGPLPPHTIYRFTISDSGDDGMERGPTKGWVAVTTQGGVLMKIKPEALREEPTVATFAVTGNRSIVVMSLYEPKDVVELFGQLFNRTDTKLDLSATKVTGRIPTEIGLMTDLTYLDLGVNRLSEKVPTELALLTKLRHLNLGNNGLSGNIPRQLSELTKLTHLGLARCRFTGTIPEELGEKLKAMRTLELNNNLFFGGGGGLSGNIPLTFGNMRKLRVLNLGSNELQGPIPTELAVLANLTYLNLEVNPLTGSIPEELAELTALTNLNFAECRLNGTIPDGLGNLTMLENMELNSNEGLMGSVPTQFGQLTALTNLALHLNPLIDGILPTQMGNLTAMQRFDLWGTNVGGPIPNELGDMTALTWLDLNSNQLTGTIPTTIAQMVNLTILNLENNDLSGEIPVSACNLSLEIVRIDCGEVSCSCSFCGCPQ